MDVEETAKQIRQVLTLEGRKIVIRKAFLFDDIEQHQPPGGPTTGGKLNVSLFAVGDCCGCPTKGAADRRQSLPATAASPAPTQTTATHRGCRSAFLVLACRWFVGWRTSVLIVKPETVLRWHRHGWRTYWRRHSSRKGKPGRRPIAPELRTLIRRMPGLAPNDPCACLRSAWVRRAEPVSIPIDAPAPAIQLNQGLFEVALTGGASCWRGARDLE